MFESTIDDIAQTYANLDKEISRHADRCTKAQENQDRLYDSIGWPLALTRCSDRIRRRATVEQHLEVMDGKLQDAEKKMKTLEAQWEASYRDEKVAWQAIVKGRGTRDIDAQNRALKAKKEKEAFKKEARAITTTYSQALEKVDEVYSHHATVCSSVPDS